MEKLLPTATLSRVPHYPSFRDPRLPYFYDHLNGVPLPSAVPPELAALHDALRAESPSYFGSGDTTPDQTMAALIEHFVLLTGNLTLAAIIVSGLSTGKLARDAATLNRALWSVSNNARLPLLYKLYGPRLVTPPVLNAVLACQWSNAGYPAVLGAAKVVGLFRYAGFVGETEGLTPPADRLVVYRGADRRAPHGVCWTTNPAMAAWFAERGADFGNPQTTVFTATVEPRDVLGLFLGRGESEVVVDPSRLSNLRELSRAERPPFQGSKPPTRYSL